MASESAILALKARIEELEDRLKFIYRHLNLDFVDNNPDPMLSPQIQDTFQRNNKIEAIKIYRELTGAGLAEAKQVIDKAEQFIK
jgi:hypothetical protein